MFGIFFNKTISLKVLPFWYFSKFYIKNSTQTMKKLLILSLLLAFVFPSEINAQRRKSKNKKETSTEKSNLKIRQKNTLIL